jgi:hypothetical protein
MGKRRRLNLTMMRSLHKRLEIPLECLVKEYKLKAQATGKRSASRK